MTTIEAKKQLTDDLKTVGRDAKELLNAAAGRAGERFGGLRGRLDSAMESGKAAAQRAREQAVSTAKATDECIRSHPYQTIAVFFGLGLLTGWLIRRKL